MSIKDRLQQVQRAEIACKAHSDKARAAWQSMKDEFRHAATPWRIVTVGVISGFFMGRSAGGAGDDSVGAKLFGSVAQALITTLGTSVTAGMAAGAAADAAVTATTDAIATTAGTGSATPAATPTAEAAVSAESMNDGATSGQ